MTTAAIIVAAGRGLRLGGDVAKQWRKLAGRPVIAHSVAVLGAVVDRVIVVIAPEDVDRAQAALPGIETVFGGSDRSGSVRAALTALSGQGISRVLIHDAARPLLTGALARAVLKALDDHDGAAPGLPVTDALWRGNAGLVAAFQDRDGLFRAQTPQGFRYDALFAAYAAHPGPAADDVTIARAAGLSVAIVPGETRNLKLTFPEDLIDAERILTETGAREKGTQMDVRVGNGFDVHAFTDGDHVMLCGVRLPHDRALLGHSDADVAMHALTDAIYGALGDGDIGQHFPPSDPQWKGADSTVFLAHAAARAAERGYRLNQADVTLICERPKIGPHAGAMRARLAGLLGIDLDRISVKATTSERLGFTGREEGIAALATATLMRLP